MIATTLLLVARVIVLVGAIAATQHCPPKFWIEGVEPSGAYQCVRTVGDDDSPPIDRLLGRVSCPGGSVPYVVDSRTVGCLVGGRR